MSVAACDACLRRTWLLERLGGHLEYLRDRVEVILGCDDRTLIDCRLEVADRREGGDDVGDEYLRFGAVQAQERRTRAAKAGLDLLCVCEVSYPQRLRRLSSPPAVLHIAGGIERMLELADADPVAIIGTRSPTPYGTDVASVLGRGASVSGLCVVSGMAMGIDAAALRGALAGGGRAIVVLPGCAAEPYPRTNRRLHEQILRSGVAVSEFGPGGPVRRWSLIARNRIIAALAELTIVVQGRARSGSLTTAEFARMLGAQVGAVPGSVLVAQSEGPHELLRSGACMIRGPQDILDAICGVGQRAVPDSVRSTLSDEQREVLDAIRAGTDTLPALDVATQGGEALLVLLAELELAGCVRRVTGGRYVASA